jgi:hypothetical protein
MPSYSRMNNTDEVANSTRTEYETLRSEIERRSTIQQALFVLNLTAVGAIADIALKSGLQRSSTHSGDRAFYLALLIPYMSFALARLWLDHHKVIGDLGAYIRDALETRLNLSWGTMSQARSERSSRVSRYAFFGAYAIVFVGPTAVALAAGSHSHPTEGRQVMWYSALAVGVLNFSGWLRACWPKSERHYPFARARMIFEPRVKAELNWDLLAQHQPPVLVRQFFIDESIDFSEWWFLWYVGQRSGRPNDVGVRNSGERTAVTDCGHLPPYRVAAVEKLEVWMKAGPRTFDICAYRTANNEYLVLDGNHRLAAGLRSGLTFGARVVEIKGPIDALRVPDLA